MEKLLCWVIALGAIAGALYYLAWGDFLYAGVCALCAWFMIGYESPRCSK